MFVRAREIKFNLIGPRLFTRPNLYWVALSGTLIVLSLVVLFTMGLNLGIEFEGGYLLRVKLEKPADVGEVRGILGQYAGEGLDASIVQAGETGDGEPLLILRMPYIEDSSTRTATIDAVTQQIDDLYGIEEVLQEEQVGSEWGREVSTKALIALVVFLFVILIYITLRLEFKMAVTAIIALIHDTLITVGIFALTGRQITPSTVIAFLTILGYSLYDTIVVFDRVEENVNIMTRSGKVSYADIVNESVNQTLMRSLGTTLTTLLPIITILIFGGETLKDFAFALFLGVFLGAYSSIIIASPLLAIWKEREPRYAAVREKVEARGAREAILISAPGSAAAAIEGGKAKAVSVEDEEALEKPEKKERKAKPQPKEAKPQAEAKEKKPKPQAKPAASKPSAQRKKPTTKGPSGGKKKKKKKKK